MSLFGGVYNGVNNAGKNVSRQAAAAAATAPTPATSGIPILSSPSTPPPGDLSGMTSWLNNQTDANLANGKSFADQYFGQGNPAIAALLKTEQQRMSGLNTDEVNAMRDQGTAQINSQLGTGLRQVANINARNHVTGGAAAGAAMPLLTNANQQQGQLANSINLANIQRQNTALGQYQSTLTGERAGDLNTMFGVAGLGAANTSGAMQYGLGQDYLDWANKNLSNSPSPYGGGSSGPNGPLGAGPAAGGATIARDVNGNPITKAQNDIFMGIPGAVGTVLQGGDATKNTPFDPNSYNNMSFNPGSPSDWRF